MAYVELNDAQIRQLINAEQVFEAYGAAHETLRSRFAGSMAWKKVEGRAYLYRARNGIWTSLGPRSAETEALRERLIDGRDRARSRKRGLTQRLNTMALVNRSSPRSCAGHRRANPSCPGRGPVTEPVIATVGTNALYAYERMAGLQIAESDSIRPISICCTARTSLRLVAPEVAASGVAGLLRKVDHSFEIMGTSGFRAANRDGCIVDLITPASKDPIRPSGRQRIGSDRDDLTAVEIAGLSWLANSPKEHVTVIDLRGYPAGMTVPDPRALALHKAWLADRPDRHPQKRRRDRAQAELVTGLISRYLPHLRFDDPVLGALPAAPRSRGPEGRPGARLVAGLRKAQRPASNGDHVGSDA